MTDFILHAVGALAATIVWLVMLLLVPIALAFFIALVLWGLALAFGVWWSVGIAVSIVLLLSFFA